MKFFHLSDLHIGLKLFNRDMREDQEYILNQIVEAAEREKPDAVVIAGDIYDKAVPSAEAVEVFDRFITDLTDALSEAAIMMISGNHDSAPRVNCFRNVLSRQKLYMVGMPPQNEKEYIEKVTLKDEQGNVNFYLLPFVKPSMAKNIVGTDENGNNLSYDETLRRLIGRENINEDERNVLVSHQFYLPSGKNAEDIERMDSEIRTVGNIDEVRADVLKDFDYAALGHIHKPMTVGEDRFRYSGTPIASSVSEAGQEKGILMVELPGVKAPAEITQISLVPMHEIRVIRGSFDEVLRAACEDYVTVILTDKKDFDVFDIKERLHAAFPRLLEIRRELIRKAGTEKQIRRENLSDPFELCCSFLPDMDEDEKSIMMDVLQTVGGVK